MLNKQVMPRLQENLTAAPEVNPLPSDEHLSVDVSLLQPWMPLGFT